MTDTLETVLPFLEEFAPLELAESWDNVGLLLGDRHQAVRRVMTCLTLTPDVADEALSRQVDLIVSHHPILFRPVQKLTTATSEGRMILNLIRSGVAVYSPHTAFDSARQGINQQLAEGLGLTEIRPLRPSPLAGFEDVGGGRMGSLPEPVPFDTFLGRIRTLLRVTHLPMAGSRKSTISTVAVACGSAGEFLSDAVTHGCDLFLTGETRFHTCLEAREKEITLVLAGHYATERSGVEQLADQLASRFPGIKVWASQVETDPVVTVSGD